MIDLKDIKELVKFFERTTLSEIEIEKDNTRIKLRKDNSSGTPAAPASYPGNVPAPSAPASESLRAESPAPAGEPVSDKIHTVKAPMVGTFYRSSGPDKDVFVKTGDTVEKGQVLCIIEAMKIFNEIEADASGKIIKIFAENAQPVEFDQPLFVIEKS